MLNLIWKSAIAYEMWQNYWKLCLKFAFWMYYNVNAGSIFKIFTHTFNSHVLTPNMYKLHARWRVREKRYKDEHKLP